MNTKIISKTDLIEAKSVKISREVITDVNKELKYAITSDVISLSHIINKMSVDEAIVLTNMLKEAGYDCVYVKEYYDEIIKEKINHDIKVFFL